ncbi:MAG: glycosyltransferase family 2 protein [Litorimonas sp.]
MSDIKFRESISTLQSHTIGNDGDESVVTFWARIVIVSYNSGEDLQTCIDHLEKQSFQNFEVVVVDNNETERVFPRLRLPNGRYSVLESERNIGFAGGSNLGARGSESDWIITLNPDSWAEPDWLEKLFLASQAYPDFSILSSVVIQAKNPDRLDSFGDYFSIFGVARNAGAGMSVSAHPREYCEVFCPTGAAAAYKCDVFHHSGGFDETFFCYLEDVDLGYRLRLFGEKCLQCPDAYIRHIGSSSTGAHSDFKYFYSYRNNVALILKNTPAILLCLMIPAFVLSQIWWIFRNRNNVGSSARLSGLKAGISQIPLLWKERRVIQNKRTVRATEIAKKYSWTIRSVRTSQFVFWSI